MCFSHRIPYLSIILLVSSSMALLLPGICPTVNKSEKLYKKPRTYKIFHVIPFEIFESNFFNVKGDICYTHIAKTCIRIDNVDNSCTQIAGTLTEEGNYTFLAKSQSHRKPIVGQCDKEVPRNETLNIWIPEVGAVIWSCRKVILDNGELYHDLGLMILVPITVASLKKDESPFPLGATWLESLMGEENLQKAAIEFKEGVELCQKRPCEDETCSTRLKWFHYLVFVPLVAVLIGIVSGDLKLLGWWRVNEAENRRWANGIHPGFA